MTTSGVITEEDIDVSKFGVLAYPKNIGLVHSIMRSAITYLLLLPAIFSMASCSPHISTPTDTTQVQSAKTEIITVPVVRKKFVKKNTKITDYDEYYLQRSIQDYFIKFCESKVTRKEIESALKKVKGPIKTLTLKVEFKEGFWDSCEEGVMVQSRTGEYVVIMEIME
jgi:hypothetical protein